MTRWNLPGFSGYTKRPAKAGRFLLIALLLLPSFAVPNALAQPALSEHEIKAGFLYQFTQFVEWPETASGERPHRFRICTAGDSLSDDALHSLEGKEVRGRTITVDHFLNTSGADACDVLFVRGFQWTQLEHVLSRLKNKPVLTVGESAGFIETGGMINFRWDNRKIRFEINQKSAESANLKISSKLLRLASRVIS